MGLSSSGPFPRNGSALTTPAREERNPLDHNHSLAPTMKPDTNAIAADMTIIRIDQPLPCRRPPLPLHRHTEQLTAVPEIDAIFPG